MKTSLKSNKFETSSISNFQLGRCVRQPSEVPPVERPPVPALRAVRAELPGRAAEGALLATLPGDGHQLHQGGQSRSILGHFLPV